MGCTSVILTRVFLTGALWKRYKTICKGPMQCVTVAPTCGNNGMSMGNLYHRNVNTTMGTYRFRIGFIFCFWDACRGK